MKNENSIDRIIQVNDTNIGNNKQKMDFTMNPKKSSIDTNKDKNNVTYIFLFLV